jgi:hypothetical protein
MLPVILGEETMGKVLDITLLVNKADGTLWYDDRSGKHATLRFAVLTASPHNVSASDFHVV